MQDIVSILCKSPKWAKVHCVVRRELEEWKTIEGREKLVIERHDDLDEYFKLSNDKYGDIHSLFCCFGTQVKVGEENFRKIDKTYPLLAADIALKNSNISAMQKFLIICLCRLQGAMKILVFCTLK